MKATLIRLSYVFGLALIWGALVFVIGVGGDFPLNDDWVQASSVFNFAQEGSLKLLPYAGATMYTQILIGGLALKAFGLSHVVLRAVTLTLALASLFSLYYLLRARHVRQNKAFLMTLLLAVSPWFLHLSFSFMTDVPFVAFLLMASALFVKGYKDRSKRMMGLSGILGIAAMLIRQNGALFFPAALIALFFARKKQGVGSLFKTQLLFSVLAFAVYGMLGWYDLLPGQAGVHLVWGKQLFAHIGEYFLYGKWYLGLLLLPLFLSIALARKRQYIEIKSILLMIASVVGILVFWKAEGRGFPFMGNIISLQGLGPTGEVLQGVESAMFPVWFWWVALLGAAVGGAWLVRFGGSALYKGLRRRSLSTDTCFIGLMFAFQFVMPLVVTGFDRYFLPALALMIAFVGMYRGERLRLRSGVLLMGIVAMALYSIVGTQNYLRWNEVRWNQANALVAQGVPPSAIQAGYEWCGWHLYEQSIGMENPHDRSKPWYVNSLCPVNTGEYVISFTEIKGYKTIKKASYNSWYDTSPFLYVLQK